jgi:sugar lactone lactonase YvrE
MKTRRAAEHWLSVSILLSLGLAFAETSVTTTAGNGRAGHDGEGGSALIAALNRPDALALDAAGNLYFADRPTDPASSFGRICVLSSNGILTTLLAVRDPSALALDAADNLYFASAADSTEGGGSRIWKRSVADGALTFLAGSGSAGASGNGASAAVAGMVVVGLTLDADGNLYFADAAARQVRKITIATGVVSAIAGNGKLRANQVKIADETDVPATTIAAVPSGGIVVAANGDVYFSERDLNRVRRIAASDGKITTVVGRGVGGWRGDGNPAAHAWIRSPGGLALDAFGNLYVADQGNQRIRRVNAAGLIFTLAGNGKTGFSGDGGNALEASFNLPAAIACRSPEALYVADLGNRRIRLLRPTAAVGASASVSAGVAPLTVQFAAHGGDAQGQALAAFHWDFGDGSTGTGASTAHVFSASGIYGVTLTGVAVSGETYSAFLVVTVGAATGSNSGASPPNDATLYPTKLTGSLNFAQSGKDKLKLRAFFEMPQGLLTMDLPVTLSVGGVIRSYVLGPGSRVYAQDGSVVLKLLPRSANLPPLLIAEVTLTGDLAEGLAAVGALDESMKTTLYGVNVSLLLGEQQYAGTVNMRYRAIAGKNGSLKLRP